MKYTIEGFSQQKAVDLGLSAEDLVILRWFVDFWPSPKMVKMVHDGKEYALVSYSGFIEQMPIIGCNKRTIARKFQKLVEADVLENATIKQGGTFSVYRFGPNYDTLVQKSATVAQECTTGSDENVQPGLYRNQQPNTNLNNSTSLLSNNLNNTSRGQAPRRFTPPTLEEVTAYCLERGNNVDPERFVDYYTSNGWMVGKNRMKDWKASVRTWERKDGQKATQRRSESSNPFYDMLREEGIE